MINRTPLKVLVLDDIHPAFFNELKGLNLRFSHHSEWSYEQVLESIHKYHVLIVNSKTKVDKTLLDKAVLLKAIGRPGSGMENIDLNDAFNRKISCFNSPEGNANAVAEHTFALLLNIANNIKIAANQIDKKIWLRTENTGFELKNKTIGIIGFGHTGSAVARLANAFSMRVLAHDKYKVNLESDFTDNYPLDFVLKNSDIISFHLPLTSETERFFNKTSLKMLRKNTVLLNVSRGKVVDIDALRNGIDNGKIRFAALDVLPVEPLKSFIHQYPEHYKWLQNNPKVLLTPHIAGWTAEAKYLMAKILAERLKKSLIFH